MKKRKEEKKSPAGQTLQSSLPGEGRPRPGSTQGCEALLVPFFSRIITIHTYCMLKG